MTISYIYSKKIIELRARAIVEPKKNSTTIGPREPADVSFADVAVGVDPVASMSVSDSQFRSDTENIPEDTEDPVASGVETTKAAEPTDAETVTGIVAEDMVSVSPLTTATPPVGASTMVSLPTVTVAPCESVCPLITKAPAVSAVMCAVPTVMTGAAVELIYPTAVIGTVDDPPITMSTPFVATATFTPFTTVA